MDSPSEQRSLKDRIKHRWQRFTIDVYSGLTMRRLLKEALELLRDKPYVGLPFDEAKQKLKKLDVERREIGWKMKEMNVGPFGYNLSTDYLNLRAQLEAIDREIDETREWYTVKVLESLEGASKRLNLYTKVLIGITVVLVIVGIVQVWKLIL